MLSIGIIYDHLGGKNDENEGVTFGLSFDNSLEKLLNTPDLWGHNPSITDYIPAATNFTKAIEEHIACANNSVDISVHAPFPDGEFLNALKKGIKRAAVRYLERSEKNKKQLTMRF